LLLKDGYSSDSGQISQEDLRIFLQAVLKAILKAFCGDF
jgi:hypothetical protein